MDVTRKLTNWKESHQNLWVMPLLRILLGAAILLKTFLFIVKGGDTMVDIVMRSSNYVPMFFGHWIPVLEIAAGILIMIGLITRACSLFQIPLFIVAIFFSGQSGVLGAFEQSTLILSIVILLLSVVFAFWGSGICSAKNALIEENKRQEAHFWHVNDQK